jgi:hypothetical protein
MFSFDLHSQIISLSSLEILADTAHIRELRKDLKKILPLLSETRVQKLFPSSPNRLLPPLSGLVHHFNSPLHLCLHVRFAFLAINYGFPEDSDLVSSPSQGKAEAAMVASKCCP